MGKNDWENLRLGDLGELRNGVNFNRHQEGRGLPVLKVKDFGTRVFAPVDDLDELDPTSIDVPKSQLLEGGDIVIIRSNGNSELVGRSVLFRGSERQVTFSGFCIRFRPDKRRIDPRFAAYLIRSPFFRNRFSAFGSGTGIQNLSQGILAEMPVLLPAISEQKHIASVLGSLDDKIDLNRRMNETLEAMARAIFKSWFVDFDPVRAKMEGREPAEIDAESASLFPSSLEYTNGGPIPTGWLETVLGTGVELLTGLPFQSERFEQSPPGTRLARGDNVKEGYFEWGSRTRYWPENNPELERYLLRAGDVLIGMDGSKVGKNWVRVRENDLPCLLVQRVARLRARSSIGDHFIALLVGDRRFKDYVGSVRTGTSIPHISGGQILSYVFHRPPLGDNRLFHRFEQIVDPLVRRQDANIRERDRLSSLRDTLLPKLLSGEIRIA